MADLPSSCYPGRAEGPHTACFISEDIDHARAVLNRFYYPAAMTIGDEPASFRLGMQVIQLGPLTVGELRYGGSVAIAVPRLDAYHVTMPVTGRLHARHAGHEVVATPSTGVVFGPGGSVYARHDANTAELAVKIERPALEAELAGLLGRPVKGPIDLPPAIDLSVGPGQSWRRLIRLLRDELARGQSLFHHPLIGGQVRSAVLSGLLLSVPHRYHRELTSPVPAGPPRAIRRVVEAIKEEPDRPVNVADLARLAGMSVRSLQDGFRRHLGSAPMTYLQQVRLERAHEELRNADPSQVTVAAVAHRWGFTHLGRFAAAYRARFGATQSETLRAPR